MTCKDNHCHFVIKRGKRNGSQQYYCKCCKKYFLDTYKIRRLDERDKKYLVHLHCLGLGTRSIAKAMEISHTCVMKTKLRVAADIPEPKLEPGQIYQVDELATFIAWRKRPKPKKGQRRKKQEWWVAHAIDAKTGRHVGFICGKRTKINLAHLMVVATSSPDEARQNYKTENKGLT